MSEITLEEIKAVVKRAEKKYPRNRKRLNMLDKYWMARFFKPEAYTYLSNEMEKIEKCLENGQDRVIPKLSNIQKRVIHQINAGYLPTSSSTKGYKAALKLLSIGYLKLRTDSMGSTWFDFTDHTKYLFDQVYNGSGEPEMLYK